MLSNISDLFTMASLVICMLLSGIIFYYLRTRISMLEQSVMDQAQLLQQVVTSLKSLQYRQMNANTNANGMMQQQNGTDHSITNQGQEQRQMALIQVSDDSGSDDSDRDSDSDSDSDSDGDSDTGSETSEKNVCTLEYGSCSKIIDLSTISSSMNYSKPSQSEIKVIELTSNIHPDHEYDNNISDDDEDDEDDDEDDEDDEDEDDGDEDDSSHDGHCQDYDQNNREQMNNDKRENMNSEFMIDNESQNNASVSNGSSGMNNGVNNKKMKSIIIEDVTASISLDEMKNMPVNSLRTLAKTKLNNIDVPTINKMSKKDILKALHE
jgi:hypothetical protein